MQRIIDELKLQSTINPNLIESISTKHGYPLWEKSRKIEKHELQYLGEAARDTIVYIPLAPEGEDKVSAFFYVILKGTISIQLYNKYDYEQFGFDTLVGNNSHNLALQFMILDYLSFGHKDFKIIDERLFKYLDVLPPKPLENVTVHIDNLEKLDMGRGWEYWTVEICTKISYLDCSSQGTSNPCCSDGSGSCCNDCWHTKLTDCKKTTIAVYNDGGDIGGQGGTPEGGGVGSGEHSGTVSTVPQQCNPTPLIVNGLPPCTKGNGLGWEVAELNIKTSLDFLLNNYDEYYFDNTINSDLYFSNFEEFKNFINAAPSIELNDEQLITQLGEVVQIATVNRSLVGGYKFFIKTKKELNSGLFSVVDISSDMWGFTLAWTFNQTSYSTNQIENEIVIDVYGVEKFNVFIESIGTVYSNSVHYQINLNKLSGKISSFKLIP